MGLEDALKVWVTRKMQNHGKCCWDTGLCSKWVSARFSGVPRGSPAPPWAPCSEERCACGVSNLPVCLFLLCTPDRPWEQLGGACLLGIGIWVMVDPTGFREIVAANPLLITGAYILLAMGGLLFLLGFLGCCGAVRENKCLLLFVSSPIPTPPMGAPGAECGGPCVYPAGNSEVTPRAKPAS